MKTIWQGAPAADRGGWFMGGGWAARPVPQEEGGEPGPNPNLLLWTEAQSNAVWGRTGGVTVNPDAFLSPTGTMTADGLSSPSLNATMTSQMSATAAAAGAAVTTNQALTAGWSRVSVTGAFDGLDYTFSIYLRGGDTGSLVQLALDRSGGVLRCRVIDQGDGISAIVWGAQLEQSATPTAYQRRDGT